jgi:hypothetical protein
MGRGVVGLDERLMALLEWRRPAGSGKLVVRQPPLNVDMRLHPIQIALARRADEGLRLDLSPGTDRLKATLVHQPGQGLGLKPPDPGVDGRPRDVPILAHAPCIPAVVIALDDLHPSPMAVGLGVIVPQPQVPLTGDRTRLPERLDGLMVN